MTVAVVLLILSNAVTLALLVPRRRRRATTGGARRVITVEVLNPIEVAAARSRLGGVAGTLAPGLITRAVHDRAMRTLRRELTAQGVVADVRLHTLVEAPDVAEPD